MGGCKDGQMVDGLIVECVDRRTDGPVNGMDGWIEGWIACWMGQDMVFTVRLVVRACVFHLIG